MTLTCVIVDDEYLAIKVLREYAARCQRVEIIESFTNPKEALAYLTTHSIDVLFLDIQMPFLSGFDLLKKLASPPMVIFTTARHDFAVEAFELDVLDYLVKPISFQRFQKSMERAEEHKEFLSSPVAPATLNYLMIRADYRIHKLTHTGIHYIQGFGEYVKIFTTSKMYISHIALKVVLGQLPKSDFIQIHKSYIVPRSFVKSFDSTSVSLSDNKILPLGRIFRKDFFMFMET